MEDDRYLQDNLPVSLFGTSVDINSDPLSVLSFFLFLSYLYSHISKKEQAILQVFIKKRRRRKLNVTSQ